MLAKRVPVSLGAFVAGDVDGGIRFSSIEKKSSILNDGASVGACVGGLVIRGSKANNSANEEVGGFVGAIVGDVVDFAVGALVGGNDAAGVLTGEPLESGSKSTT